MIIEEENSTCNPVSCEFGCDSGQKRLGGGYGFSSGRGDGSGTSFGYGLQNLQGYTLGSGHGSGSGDEVGNGIGGGPADGDMEFNNSII